MAVPSGTARSMPSLEPPAVLAPKLVTTRPRSGQRNDGMPAAPAGPASSDCASAAGVAIRAESGGFTDCKVGPFNDATTCGFAAGVAVADAAGAFLATAPGLAGMVSFIPILRGISAVMLLARTSSRTV